MRPRLPTLLVIALVALTLAASVGLKAAEAMQSDGCLTAAHAKEQAQNQTNQSMTILINGWVGPNGTKLEAWAGESRLGCTLTDSNFEKQYLLAQGEVEYGTRLSIKRNNKLVVTQPITPTWAARTVLPLEIKKPVPTVRWTPGKLTIQLQNLGDTYQGHFATSQPRPWGEVLQMDPPFTFSPNRPIDANVLCQGVYLPGQWTLFVEGEKLGEGVIPRQECDTDSPEIRANIPSTGVAGRPHIIYGSGFGSSRGRVEIELNNVVLTPSISSWDNWEIHTQIPSQATPGNWNLTVLSPLPGGLMRSNLVRVIVIDFFHLYLPRLDRGSPSGR